MPTTLYAHGLVRKSRNWWEKPPPRLFACPRHSFWATTTETSCCARVPSLVVNRVQSSAPACNDADERAANATGRGLSTCTKKWRFRRGSTASGRRSWPSVIPGRSPRIDSTRPARGTRRQTAYFNDDNHRLWYTHEHAQYTCATLAETLCSPTVSGTYETRHVHVCCIQIPKRSYRSPAITSQWSIMRTRSSPLVHDAVFATV